MAENIEELKKRVVSKLKSPTFQQGVESLKKKMVDMAPTLLEELSFLEGDEDSVFAMKILWDEFAEKLNQVAKAVWSGDVKDLEAKTEVKAEITEEVVEKWLKIYMAEQEEEKKPEPPPLDIGFKVYRQADGSGLLFDRETEIDSQKVLPEIMLVQGYELDSDCKRLESFDRNAVYRIEDANESGGDEGKARVETVLYVCLDLKIYPETVGQIYNLDRGEKKKFICLDAAIDDFSYDVVAAVCTIETMRTHGCGSFYDYCQKRYWYNNCLEDILEWFEYHSLDLKAYGLNRAQCYLNILRLLGYRAGAFASGGKNTELLVDLIRGAKKKK